MKHSLANSYGAMMTVMEFLDELESTKMQGLNRWWYEVNLPRLQYSLLTLKANFLNEVTYLLLEGNNKVFRYDCLRGSIQVGTSPIRL